MGLGMVTGIGGAFPVRRLTVVCLALAGTLGAACGGSSSSGSGISPADMTISPNVGYAGIAVPAIIDGTGFLAKATQPQGGGPPVLDTQHRAWLGSVELTDVKWQGTTELTGTVPADLPAGTYDLTVENALGKRGTVASAYTAVAAPAFAATATLDHTTASVGQALTLTVTVTNNGGGAVDALALSVPTVSSSDGGSARPTSGQPAPPASLAAGDSVTFHWTYAAAAAGHIAITLAVTGTDHDTHAPLTASLAAPAQALIQSGSALTPTWVNAPTTQTITLPVTLTLQLDNAAGSATAAVTDISPTVNPATNVTCTAVSPAPTPSAPVQIPSGGAQPFTWQCTATAPGDYQLGATVAATDVNTGASLNVTPTTLHVTYTTDTLSVTASPAAAGTFTCSGTGVAADCTSAPRGVQVTAHETPAAGYTFSSWSGVACTGGQTGTSCTFTMPASAAAVTATFTADAQPLTVEASPAGTGTFTCSGTGVAADCSSADTGATVTVHQSASTGYSFSGWSGVTCTGGQAGATCSFVMPAGGESVTATFTGVSHALTVTPSPAATGTFTCTGTGVAANCSAAPTGASVTVHETPAAGYNFTSWTGACTGTGTSCTFTMPATAASVTGNFTAASQPLTVTASPTASGTFTCTGTGVAANCTSAPTGATVTIHEAPAAGYAFSGWSSVTCTGGQAGTTCSFVMPAGGETVTGNFLVLFQLSVTIIGNGTVTCDTGSGPTACAGSYPANTSLWLTESPGFGSTFLLWAGDCVGSGGSTCSLLMTADHAATALFNP
jgi:uncharacterized repeat protein (TIGR02543 family)